MAPVDFNAGEYYLVVYNQIWTKLQDIARSKRFSSDDYDQYLGFDFLSGKPLKEAQVTQALKYLQLVSKAVYLALNTPSERMVAIEVTGIDETLQGTLHGAEGQPALLREFPFEWRVLAAAFEISHGYYISLV